MNLVLNVADEYRWNWELKHRLLSTAVVTKLKARRKGGAGIRGDGSAYSGFGDRFAIGFSMGNRDRYLPYKAVY